MAAAAPHARAQSLKRSGHGLIAWGPLAGTCALIALFLVYLRVLRLDGPEFVLAPGLGNSAEVLHAVWIWMIASVLFETAALGSSLLFGTLLFKVARSTWGIVVVAAVLLGVALWFFFPRMHQSFGGGLALQLLSLIRLHDDGAVPFLLGLSNLIAALAIGTAMLLGLALANSPEITDVEDGRLRVLALSTSLHTSAILLVLGVIEIWALFHLAAVSAPLDLAADARRLQNLFPITAGATFTILLAIIYLPPAIALHRRVHAWADGKVALDKSRAEWLAHVGLTDPLGLISGYLVALAPLATSLITAHWGSGTP